MSHALQYKSSIRNLAKSESWQKKEENMKITLFASWTPFGWKKIADAFESHESQVQILT